MLKECFISLCRLDPAQEAHAKARRRPGTASAYVVRTRRNRCRARVVALDAQHDPRLRQWRHMPVDRVAPRGKPAGGALWCPLYVAIVAIIKNNDTEKKKIAFVISFGTLERGRDFIGRGGGRSRATRLCDFHVGEVVGTRQSIDATLSSDGALASSSSRHLRIVVLVSFLLKD